MAQWEHSDGKARLSTLIPGRDYSGMNRTSEQLRVWLPEPARVGLEEICERADLSMTAYLIEFFAAYLYGHHEVLKMQEGKTGLYEPVNRRSCAMSVSGPVSEPPPEPNFGKNIFAMKIFISDRIKSDLQALACLAGITLGEFTRELICAHLFGREYGPGRLMLWTEDELRQAKDWESDGED